MSLVVAGDGDYAELTAAAALPQGTSWTLAGWVRVSSLSGGDNDIFSLTGAGNEVDVGWNGSAFGGWHTAYFTTASNPPAAGTWFYCYGKFAVGTTTLEVGWWDGAAWVTGSISATAFDAASLSIGNASTFASGFSGKMGYVRCWNTALTQTQLQAEKDAASAIVTAGLLDDLSFETDATDGSGNGNNATLVGGAAIDTSDNALSSGAQSLAISAVSEVEAGASITTYLTGPVSLSLAASVENESAASITATIIGIKPAYLSGLARFEVRVLSGAYAPASGGTSMQDVTPSEWLTNDPGNLDVDAVLSSWSGGIGDSANHALYIFGGGHRDSANNGLYRYTFDEATQGFDVPSQSAVAAVQDGETYTDGRASARHTYGGVFLYADRPYLYGGVPWSSTGGFVDSVWKYDEGTDTWSQLPTPNGVNSGQTPIAVVNETAGKAFLCHSGSYNGQFVDLNAEALGTSTAWNGNPTWQDSTYGYDSSRSRIVRGGADRLLWTLDWSAETMVETSYTPTGDTAILNEVATTWLYDVARDCFWIFGGNQSSAGWTSIYKMDAGTFGVTAYPLSGASVSFSASSANWHGSYGRGVLLADWDAIGFVANTNGGAYVISLVDTSNLQAAINPAAETEAAGAIGKVLPLAVSISAATEAEAGVAVVLSVGTSVAISPAGEVEAGDVVSASAPLTLAVGVAAEFESASALAGGAGVSAIARVAFESEGASAIQARTPQTASISPAQEIETVDALSISRGVSSYASPAHEVEIAEAITPNAGQVIVLIQIQEYERASAVGAGVDQFYNVGRAAEVESAVNAIAAGVWIDRSAASAEWAQRNAANGSWASRSATAGGWQDR